VYYEIVESLFRIWSETVDTPWPQSRVHEQLQQLEASLLASMSGGATSSRTRRHVEGQMLADVRASWSAAVE
jgi:hypothetical protein